MSWLLIIVGLISLGAIVLMFESLDRRSLEKLKQKENPSERDLARIAFLEQELYVPPEYVPPKPVRRCSRKRFESSNSQCRIVG
jgi:hypothetical protein